jgi:hypothetical protein
MLEAQRLKLAYLAARLSGLKATSVYSYSSGEHSQMSGSGGEFFDYRRGERFSEREDHATGARWTIELKDGAFSGYNFGTKEHFSGTIDAAGLVRFHDYGTGEWYDYAAQG